MDRANRIEWRKIGKWKTPFLMECMIIESTDKEILKKLGFNLWFHNFLSIYGENYIDQRDYEEYIRHYRNKLKKEGITYFRKYADLIRRKGNEAIKFSLEVKKRDLSKTPPEELKKLFSRFLNKVKPNMALAYTIQMVDEVLADALKEKLRKYSAEEADSLFARLTHPKEEALMIKEKRDLTKISMADSADKDELLQKHKEEYGWMKSPNWNEPVYEADYYLKRLKKITHAEEELKEIQEKRLNTEKEINTLINKIENRQIKIKEYVDLIRTLVNVKMFNWDSISISGNNCRNLFTRIGQYGGFSHYDVIELMPAEISHLLDGEEIPERRIKSRREHPGLLRLGSKIYELDKNQIKDIRRHINESPADAEQLNGIPVYLGRVKGRAFVIMHSDRINKMKKGRVLVCPMTNPDYMPAINKAKAIVTDEGGILCHAAIVSREFKIPCIIGTKAATKAFKDGDELEVDANKGIVRRISPAKKNS